MFLVDWLTTLLRLLGLSSKKARIIILGALAVDTYALVAMCFSYSLLAHA